MKTQYSAAASLTYQSLLIEQRSARLVLAKDEPQTALNEALAEACAKLDAQIAADTVANKHRKRFSNREYFAEFHDNDPESPVIVHGCYLNVTVKGKWVIDTDEI